MKLNELSKAKLLRSYWHCRNYRRSEKNRRERGKRVIVVEKVIVLDEGTRGVGEEEV